MVRSLRARRGRRDRPPLRPGAPPRHREHHSRAALVPAVLAHGLVPARLRALLGGRVAVETALPLSTDHGLSGPRYRVGRNPRGAGEGWYRRRGHADVSGSRRVPSGLRYAVPRASGRPDGLRRKHARQSDPSVRQPRRHLPHHPRASLLGIQGWVGDGGGARRAAAIRSRRASASAHRSGSTSPSESAWAAA